jgi:hypothetical protein
VASGGDFLEQSEPPLLYQGAAAFAVADEFDDVSAAALEFRELEGARDTALGRLLVLNTALRGGYQSVEVEGQIQRLAGLAVIIEGIDLIDFHQEGGHVLDEGGEFHDGVGADQVGIVRGEIDVHPLLEAPVFVRGEQRRPLLRVAYAVDDLRLGEQAFEEVVADPGAVFVVVCGLAEEVQQILADERFLVADRGQVGEPKTLVELGHVIAPGKLLAYLVGQVGDIARQLHVFEETVVAGHAMLLVVAEAVIEHMRLEGVVNGVERLDERPEPVEVGLERGGVGLQVHFVLGGQPGEIRVAEGDLVAQPGIFAE